MERKTLKATQQEEAQEPLKDGRMYKITQGNFESKSAAIAVVMEAKKKGFYAQLIVESGKYKLLYAEGMKKTSAEEVLQKITKTGLSAELSPL